MYNDKDRRDIAHTYSSSSYLKVTQMTNRVTQLHLLRYKRYVIKSNFNLI